MPLGNCLLVSRWVVEWCLWKVNFVYVSRPQKIDLTFIVIYHSPLTTHQTTTHHSLLTTHHRVYNANPMRPWLRKFWPAMKILFTAAILIAVGRYFFLELRRASDEGVLNHSFHPGWLIIAGGLYILGLGCSAWFWIRLLRSVGERPSVLPAVRAYYLGHFGKYLPGKAWALVLRATLARGAGVGLAMGGMTSLYEVLTTMAAGALLAVIIFAVDAPDTLPPGDWSGLRRLFTQGTPDSAAVDRKVLVALALCMLVMVGLPIIPLVFNRLIRRLRSLKNLMSKQPSAAMAGPPRLQVRTSVLLEGLAMTAFGWMLLGASLWAVLQAVLDEPRWMTLAEWGRLSAILSLSYVAGFIIVLIPSGLGIREFFLHMFLIPELSLHWTGEGGLDLIPPPYIPFAETLARSAPADAAAAQLIYR